MERTGRDSDVGDFMMVTDLRCWWRNHFVGDFFRYVGDFFNISNRSPISQICHQDIWSPTCVTNINVASERGDNGVKYHLVKVIWMDEDDTVNHYEANYQFIFTWSMIRLVVSTDLGSRSVMVCIGPNVTMSHGP